MIRKYSTLLKILVFFVILVVVVFRMMNGVFYRYTIDDYDELRSELIVKNPGLQIFPENIPASAFNVTFYNNIGSGSDKLSFGIGYCLPLTDFRLCLNALEGSYPEASKLDPARSILFRRFPDGKMGVDRDLPPDIRIFLIYGGGMDLSGEVSFSQKCVVATSAGSNCILYYLDSW